MFRSRMPVSLEAWNEGEHAPLWDASKPSSRAQIFWRLDEDIAVDSCICIFAFSFE
jgi:hypothetical protein